MHTVMFGKGSAGNLRRMIQIVKDFSEGDEFSGDSSFEQHVDAIALSEHFEQLASSLNQGGGISRQAS